MKGRNFWYLVTLAAFVLLPLAGCSGGGSGTVVPGEKGTSLTVSGTVSENGDAGKTLGKIVSAVTDPLSGTVSVLNAADSTVLASTSINADGSFSGLTFTLPATKSLIVFKATTNKSATPFYTITPIDLSNPPAAGIGVSNTITIAISQASTNTAATVSAALGLAGILGETGNALPTGQTYTTAAQLVTQYGGQVLAYNTSGLSLTGSVKETLLPAQDANTLTGDQINTLALDGAITSVAIPGNNPIISFQVINKATGKGVRGLKSFAFAIVQLKPGTNGGPDEWLSYMISDATTGTPPVTYLGRPSTETGTNLTGVIDNGDGSYVYKMARNVKATTTASGLATGVTYDANLTHRVAIQVRTAPVAGTTSTGAAISNFTNAANLVYDFVPASGAPVTGMLQREVVTTAACNECHTKIGTSTPHGGRVDTRFCVVCHTKQRGNGRTASTEANGVFTAPLDTSTTSANYNKPTTYVVDGEAQGNMVTMIHKIHMGSRLTKTPYNYANVLFNEVVYPKDILNCRQCHKAGAGAQGDNWQTRPSRQACGSCHDNINFATGANLKTGGVAHIAQTSDADCGTCHAVASTSLSPDKAHLTELASPNNPNVLAGLANFTYEINSATVDASNQAVIKFRIMKSVDGSTPAAVVLDGNATNPVSGFTGGPSFLLAYNLSATNQPFATSPDYNNVGVKAAQPISVSIASLMPLKADGTANTAAKGTLSAPDASGYYTATITVAASNFPAGAKMRAVALQGYFTQVSPAAARHTVSVQKAVTGDVVRRKVVDPAKCQNCHEWFEGHGGNRVWETQVCVMCHVPNLSSSGKGANAANVPTTMSADQQLQLTADGYTLADPTTYPEETNNFKDMIHGIHAGSSRTNPLKFVRDRGSVVMYFTAGHFKFPGILKDCTMCHVPVSSSNPSYAGVPTGAQVTTDQTSDGTVLTLANNITAVSAARTSLPNAQDLVTTPFSAACVSCHDAVATVGHMKLNGGQIRVARSTANPAGETCVVCHGPTGTANVVNAHK